MLWVNTGNAQDTPVAEESEAFLEAVSAFEKKEFQTAVELFTVLGEQGEPTSQHNLSICILRVLGARQTINEHSTGLGERHWGEVSLL